MPFILFTIVEENQRINPFNQAGIIHNAGLDYIIANISSGEDMAQLTTEFIIANYTTYVIYAEQTIDPLSVKGFNVTINPTGELIDIDLDGGYNEYVQRVFSYLDTFPPTGGANTLSQSYVIFNADYADQFNLDMDNLLDAILDSGLPQTQMDLALIALSILKSSYIYWKNVYNNTGGGASSWYNYITGIVASINDINWRQLIKQDIKGALQGAVAANRNNLDNINGSQNIGAAAAGMAASAQNVMLQTGVIADETFIVLFVYDFVNGYSPSGLTNVSGVLYGTVQGVEGNSLGLIFSIKQDGSDYTDVHDFDNGNGASPFSDLINISGVLYGTSENGGAFDYGVVYSTNPDGSGFTNLHDFNLMFPITSLVNVGGVLYGITSTNIMYSINPDGSGYSELYTFSITPCAELIGVSGVLFGMTNTGGAHGDGMIFSIHTDGTNFTDIYDFDGTNGAGPACALLNVSGVLYGTTSGGGANSCGVIFSINPNGTGFTKLYDFDNASGVGPFAALILNGGVLYGTTNSGGAYNYGTIFSINTDGTGFAILHSFDGINGGNPESPLVYVDGALFGTTTNNYGIIFKLII